MGRAHLAALIVAPLVAVVCAPAGGHAEGGRTIRVSVRDDGGEALGGSRRGAVSWDGSVVAFDSIASNLVAADTNRSGDVFVRDLGVGSTEIVSVAADGGPANSYSYEPALSFDGSKVAFSSFATNLTASDTNRCSSPGWEDRSCFDVFLRDRTAGVTVRVSVAMAGSGETDGDSHSATVSADGTLVGFRSDATNITPGDTNGVSDVFVRDIHANVSTLVSVAADGGPADGASGGVVLSAGGRYAVFHSRAANLVSEDGNGHSDVFIRDLEAGVTRLVSRNKAGAVATGPSYSPTVSADGRFVAFVSEAADIVAGDNNGHADVFLHDVDLGTTILVSRGVLGEADGDSSRPALSADGRWVAFESEASTLAVGDWNAASDVFVYDRLSAATAAVSVSSLGFFGEPGFSALEPAISPDGRSVVFYSVASTLVTDDRNLTADVFLRDRWVD